MLYLFIKTINTELSCELLEVCLELREKWMEGNLGQHAKHLKSNMSICLIITIPLREKPFPRGLILFPLRPTFFNFLPVTI